MTDLCGVYRIYNKLTRREYIGGATTINKRFSHHRFMLNHGKHACRPLQRDWGLYPTTDWVFEVLQVCDRSELKTLETKWITKRTNLYNQHPSATAKGFKHTTKTKKLMSTSAKLVGAPKAERLRRSKRAKVQHQQGRFGASTWIIGQANKRVASSKLASTIRQKLRAGREPEEIAAKYHVSRSTIYRIKNGKYANLPAEEQTRLQQGRPRSRYNPPPHQGSLL